MEVKEKSKKRELIKTIAIIFLAVLLVLTFFSQTIMNRSLPEVATQLVTSGTINAKIRGSGTVSANESYEVILDQTREIRSVCVKVGDKVEQGDLLFVLGDVESQELKEAQESLSKQQIEYQKQILSYSKDYATEDLSVKNLREDLQKALAARDANLVTETDISYAKGDLAAAQTQLSQLTRMIEELKAIQAESEEYTEAQTKVKELETKVETLNTTIETKRKELNDVTADDALSADRKIEDARRALEEAQTNWAGDWAANVDVLNSLGELNLPATPRALSSYEQVQIEGKLGELQRAEWNTPAPSPDGDGDGKAMRQSNAYGYDRCLAAYNTLLADQKDVADKQQAYQRALQDKDASAGTVAEKRQAIQREIDAAQSELAGVQQQLRDARQRLEALAGANSQVKEQLRLYEAGQREQTAAVEELKTKLEELQAKQKDYEAALTEIAAKERALEEALSGKDIDKQLNNLNLEAMRLEISRLQALVDKYQKDAVDTEIPAKVSGIISAVNVTAGKENKPGEAMAVIDVIDRGYTIKISVTAEQAKQVKVGDTAEVTNFYWGSDITATLEQITPDPANPGQNKLLVFRLTGEIDAGTNISLSIGQRSSTFNTIVPKSALRQDTNGSFVLVITSRNTPLGNRYTATRVDVQVLAEDDTSAAVTGIAENDYVITTSSKPLAPGTQVRMVENP